ncbi:MAG: hypothetical protein ACRDUV_17655, partial [Pseudonocardiaceae bacterium]
AWTQSGRFTPDGTVPDSLARHEATHSRTVAALGELGFYVTYVTIGAIWGGVQGGSWNNLNAAGCGNPFEKTAHTFTGDPATARSTSGCRQARSHRHARSSPRKQGGRAANPQP